MGIKPAEPKAIHPILRLNQVPVKKLKMDAINALRRTEMLKNAVSEPGNAKNLRFALKKNKNKISVKYSKNYLEDGQKGGRKKGSAHSTTYDGESMERSQDQIVEKALSEHKPYLRARQM